MSATIISRSNGQSAVASAAYRSGEFLRDERLQVEFDYTRKELIQHTEIMLPEDAPSRWMDREVLWNEVEAAETRKNSQVAREVRFAVPREFSQDEQLALARDYIREQFVDRGMVADFALHYTRDDNPHVHVMLTTRAADASGFTDKVREWNTRDILREWRAGLETIQNMHIDRHSEIEGIPEEERDYVSALSYKDRGIDRKPQIHEGYVVTAIERREQAACEREGREYEPVTRVAQYNSLVRDENALQRLAEHLRELGVRVMEQVRSARDFVIDHFTHADELREQRQDITLENKELRAELKERELEVAEKKEELEVKREPYAEQIQERDNAIKRKEEEIDRAESRLKELKDDWRPHPVEIPKLETLIPDLKEEGQNLRMERDEYAAAVDRHFESQTQEMEGLTNRVENITVTQEQNIDQINELNRAYNLEVRDGKKAYKELDREEQQDVKRELGDSPSFQKEIASKEEEREIERPEIEQSIEREEPNQSEDIEIENEPSGDSGDYDYDYEDEWELER